MCGLFLFFPVILSSQTLQVTLSPEPSNVNRSTDGGIATIFFDSDIEDLSIECTDQNPNELIRRDSVNNRWYMNIDVLNDKEDVCYRKFRLKCSKSAVYSLTTDEIQPNQVLYYTVVLPNEMQPKVLKALVDNANKSIEDGDYYLARMLALEALPTDLSNPEKPYLPEAEAALRKACAKDKTRLDVFDSENSLLVKSASYADSLLLIGSLSRANKFDLFNIKTGQLFKSNVGIDLEEYDLCVDNFSLAHSRYDKKKHIYICNYTDTAFFSGKNYSHVLEFPSNITNDDFDIDLIRFSQDGNFVASCFEVRDSQNSELTNDSSIVLYYDQDGNFVTKTTHSIIVFDVNKERVVTVLNNLNAYNSNPNISDVSFSSDNKYVLIKCSSQLQFWDLFTGQNVCNKLIDNDNSEQIYDFDRDTKQLYLINEDGNLQIWDLVSEKCINTINLQDSRFLSVMFDPSQKLILTTSSDGKACLWHAITGKLVCDLEDYDKDEENFIFVPNSSRIASCIYMDQTTNLILRDTESGKLINSTVLDKEEIDELQFVSIDKIVYQTEHGFFMRDIKDCLEKMFVAEETDYIVKSREGLVGVVCDDSALLVKNVKSGRVICEITPPFGKHSAAVLSEYGDLLCLYSYSAKEDECFIYSTSSGKCIKTIRSKTPIQSVSGSFSEKNIAVINDRNDICIYDLNSGKFIGDVLLPVNEKLDCPQMGLAFNADGTKLVADIHDDNSDKEYEVAYIIDVLAMEITDTICFPSLSYGDRPYWCGDIDVSPDGKYVLMANSYTHDKNTLRIWNIDPIGLVLKIDIDDIPGIDAWFTNDNQILISHGKQIKFFDFPPLQQLIDETRERFKDRKFTDEEKKQYHLE